MVLSPFFILSALSGAYAAVGHSASNEIFNKKITPDGYIIFSAGDRFRLNMIAKLDNADMLTDTSIHWHGLFQQGTNFMDGPVGVNQCPITTGHAFEYNFAVPDQAVVFASGVPTLGPVTWRTYCDGLRGALVVYDPKDPARHMYDLDNESTVITLADWYHYDSLHAPQATTPFPNSTLINGLGRYENGPLAVIDVHHGKRYRVDQHLMTIIEVDGVNHQPLVVDSIEIWRRPSFFPYIYSSPQDAGSGPAAGQRYSFVLTANQPVSNYCIPPISPPRPHVRSARNSTYNWDNPVTCDVTSAGNSTDDLTTFRFTTDNAGPWFLHCHIDWHLFLDLAVVFAEDIPTISEINPPVAWDQLCAINNSTN
ncbi:bilirubin oxidase [Mycena polygramma]|nr:bilirubin oxidase [Mycena polygramma]